MRKNTLPIWKKIISGITCVLIWVTSSQIASAETIDATLTDDSTQVNPLITLRSLATGSPLINGQYEDERNLTWIISEVLPSQTFFQNIAGITQFRVPGLSRCLYTIQNRIIAANCDPLDSGSLWKIIPSSKGGVQVKSLRNNLCLSAGASHSDFRLASCQEVETEQTSVKLLWIFAPAAVNASLSPELPQ